jgi:hypothetical protein
MRTGALLEEPMASMAATVLGGMGDSERVKGERLDSSQPDNSPPAGANQERARSRFANGLNCIDRSPAEGWNCRKSKPPYTRFPYAKVTGTLI